MNYTYKMNHIYLQGVFAIVFFLMSLVFGQWIVAAIGAFIAFILIRDCIKLKETHFEIKKDRIEMYLGKALKKSIRFNDFEYVTRTKKNVKWVVIGHMKEQIILKPSMTGFEEMVKEVLIHLKDNKEVYIHHTIEGKY